MFFFFFFLVGLAIGDLSGNERPQADHLGREGVAKQLLGSQSFLGSQSPKMGPIHFHARPVVARAVLWSSRRFLPALGLAQRHGAYSLPAGRLTDS